MLPNDRSVEVMTFVAKARRSCEFIRTASSHVLPERLRVSAQLLAELYSASLSLPDAQPRPEAPEPDLQTPDWEGLGEHELYWEIFDPYDMNESAVVAGSLSDDLLDVYLDVGRGLVLFEAGEVETAVWHWRLHREVHWGDHAVDALRALQRALRR